MATKAKPLELTAEQRKFLRSSYSERYVSTRQDALLMGLVQAGCLIYDGVQGMLHRWKITDAGRAALKRSRPERTLKGSKQAAGGRSVAARPQSKGNTHTYSGRLGAAVRKRREELGLSVESFVTALASHETDITTHTVYHWEKGLRPIPLNAVPAIAKVLKVAIRDLLPAK